MHIWVNGEAQEVQEGTTIATLLETLQLNQGKVAVERNEEVVIAKERAQCTVHEGDRIEIVTFVGGG